MSEGQEATPKPKKGTQQAATREGVAPRRCSPHRHNDTLLRLAGDRHASLGIHCDVQWKDAGVWHGRIAYPRKKAGAGASSPTDFNAFREACRNAIRLHYLVPRPFLPKLAGQCAWTSQLQ